MAGGSPRNSASQDIMVSAAAGDDKDDKSWSNCSSRGLPHLRFLSQQGLDHGRYDSSRSESSEERICIPNEAGSSNSIINTNSLMQSQKYLSPRGCNHPTQEIASDRSEGQFGAKRLHPPNIVSTKKPVLGSSSTNQAHSFPRGAFLDQIRDNYMKLPAVPSYHTQLGPPELEEDIEADNKRHHKKSRRAEASVITPSAETQRLEEQLTYNLLRSHGRAGTEIPEQDLDLNAGRHSLNNALLPRYSLDFNAMADLQNLLDFLEPSAPRHVSRERSSQPLLHAMADREFTRSLLSTQSSIPSAPPTSYLPPSLPLGSKSIIYLSEILPRSFDQRKRADLLATFRTKASYVPSCINLASGLQYGIQYHVLKPPRSDLPRQRLSFGSNGQGWPRNRLPLEVFHIISEYLPRDALQNMRLVNHEFESKLSNALFHTVVVPFRPEIYGMMVQQSNPQDTMIMDVKGKGRELPIEPEMRVHDGMRTFQGWGPHIKKFAMAFEVEESTLEKPPPKGRFETHGAFWGRYRWPHPNYNRYEYCEDLEKKADEFRCMSTALSNLTGVTELGLSIDSGLGWLNGPDISDRAQLLREKPRIFGKSQQHPDSSTQERHNTWNQILTSTIGCCKHPTLPARNGFYEATVYWPPPLGSWTSREPTFEKIPHFSIAPENLTRPLIFGGVNIRRLASSTPNEERFRSNKICEFSKAPLTPNYLSTSQQEWLLEIEWAQRAFISSFCMALSDNSQVFSKVTTLSIARLSSRHLPSLQRVDFWKALQNLSNLTIHVAADWRNILKTATGSVEAPAIIPSKAAVQFHDLLKSHVFCMRNIKAVEIGYVGGGEHQTGIHGRNRHILPAPVVSYSDLISLSSTAREGDGRSSTSRLVKNLIIPKHVENLTLTNCWFPPVTLKIFCTRMRLAKLKQLTLKSVSLCFQSSIGPSLQEPSTELIGSLVPQGPPRYGDPSVANFFALRPRAVKDPQSHGWIRTPQRIGSWGQVIDFVTPGANLDFVRYAYQYYDKAYFDSLKRPDPQNLESIAFESCGYVHLPYFKEFNQEIFDHNRNTMPAYLSQRASDLATVLMDGSCDKFLGQIVTTFPIKEVEVLETGFPMVFGWDDKAKAADCLEDGQPMGGSGRFSGKVQRLTYPADANDGPTRVNLPRDRRR